MTPFGWIIVMFFVPHICFFLNYKWSISPSLDEYLFSGRLVAPSHGVPISFPSHIFMESVHSIPHQCVVEKGVGAARGGDPRPPDNFSRFTPKTAATVIVKKTKTCTFSTNSIC